MPLPRFSWVLAAALAACATPPVPAQTQQPTPQQIQFFETKVRPVLAANCFGCHGPKKQRGDLRLDSRAGMLEGGDTGPAIVPGKPGDSLLLKAVHYQGP